MSERIRELAHQATEWCMENAQGTPVAWEWEDKFGELIVQDCMAVIEQRNYLSTKKICQDECTAILAEIKQHFGVSDV